MTCALLVCEQTIMNEHFLFVKYSYECAPFCSQIMNEHIHNIVCSQTILNEHFLFVNKLYYESQTKMLFLIVFTNIMNVLFLFVNKLYYECALFVCSQTKRAHSYYECALFVHKQKDIMNVLFLFVNKLYYECALFVCE